jgi:hypothetical protein
MLRCNGRDAPPSWADLENVSSGVLDVGVPDGARSRRRRPLQKTPLLHACGQPIPHEHLRRVAPCFRTPLLGRVDRSSWAGFRNLTIVKVSSRAYPCSTSLSQSCGTTRLRSGLGYGPAPAPGIPNAIDSRRVRCKSRRLRAPATHFPFSARRHGVRNVTQDIGGSERLPAGRERTSNVRQLQSIGDGCKRDVATANTAARQVKVSASRAIFVRHLRNPPPRHT